MLISAHTITAGVTGEKIGDPAIAFLVGIIIHFILDAIPHYDTTNKGRWTVRQYSLMFADMLVGLIIIYYSVGVDSISSSFIWGLLGGITPDILDNTPFWSNSFRKTLFGRIFHQFHARIQTWSAGEPGPVLGLAIQYILIAAMIYFR